MLAVNGSGFAKTSSDAASPIGKNTVLTNLF